MNICGFQKTTLLDYPGHIGATIFLGGCNFRCPFCQNASLLSTTSPALLPTKDVLATLKKRKHLLEGVCISGGEPTIHSNLTELIHEIKKMGFLVKLDTNGYHPDFLYRLIEEKLLDYVAMDIKNSKEKYPLTSGLPHCNISNISESISLLLENYVEYEFRTTVINEFHTRNDFLEIGSWIKGAKAYYLQPFQESKNVLVPGLTSPEWSELIQYQLTLIPYVQQVEIRGIH